MQAPAHLTHSAADVNRLSARAQDTKAGALSGDVRPEPISRFFERWAPARRKGITPSAVKHQEEICAWHVPVVPTETVTVDRSDDRRVDPLVPVGSDFRFPEGSVLLAHQVVAVDLEIFEQLEIDGWPARGEAHAVARSGKAALLEEYPLELAQDDVDHVRPGRERDAGDELSDVSVDGLAAILPRERDAMVAVDNEVRVSELDGDNRRESPVRKRGCKRAQTVAAERVPRLELARERRDSALGAKDVLERDRANAEDSGARTASAVFQPPRAQGGWLRGDA